MPTVPAIPEAVSHLVRHLWAAAWKAADSVREPVREKFQRGRVEAERVKAESTARTLQAELTELRDEKRKTPETVTAWVERASRAEARLEELAKGAEGRCTWVRSQAF